MKLRRIGYLLALSLILILLIPLFPTPAHAAERLFVYPYEGKIGDYIEIDGASFRENDIVGIYLSSQKAKIGESIDEDVTAYEQVVRAATDASGNFGRTYTFYLPDALTDGEDIEDVHDGDYYFYAVYVRSHQIVAYTVFTVINGEISLDLEEGTVGTEVEVSGQGLRPNQEITIQYDGYDIDIASGDSQTDNNGAFTCTIIIPESSAGSHIIIAVDESGNTPEAEFTVKPFITIDPSEQATGGEVRISGTGFAKRGNITITLDYEEVDATPLPLTADHYGSFEGSFLVPFIGSYGTREVEARDDSLNKARAQLAVQGGITLSPLTSLIEPGHVGMELVISGTGFSIGSTVALTYSDNAEEIPIDTVTAENGTFRVDFIVPPSLAGSHDITATDGTSTATAAFLMESQAPPTPTPLTPKVAGTAGTQAYFDWSDVSDDSGVSYTLQLAVDADFNAIVLEKEGLPTSEYTLTEEEKLEPAEKEAPYYWRVKAVDGAFNDSGWTHPRLFYVGFSWAALPNWVWYILGGIGVVLLGMLGFWIQRRRVRAKIRTL
ncbi:hypothetical protein ES703_10480 [subsurface metagenome]